MSQIIVDEQLDPEEVLSPREITALKHHCSNTYISRGEPIRQWTTAQWLPKLTTPCPLF
jgi:hypothetical protein